ncbi:ParA family protein [Leifsonia shinshuensis]
MTTTEIDRDAFGRVVVIINGKGGVLKTTLASNLGGLLANPDFRVLGIDLDPQGDMGVDLGYRDREIDDKGNGLAAALLGFAPVKPVQVRPNFDVLIGGPKLHEASAGLVAQAGKNADDAKLALARAIAPIVANYDLVLIDCPPNDEMLQNAAVAAGRWALVPTKTDKASILGLEAVATRLDTVINVNPSLDLLGVVLAGVGTAQKRGDEVILRKAERSAREDIAALFGTTEGIVFDRTIRHSEETGTQSRKAGLLVHELEGRKKDQPAWWAVRRGEARATDLIAGAVGSVAEDLQMIGTELIERIATAEAEEAAQMEGQNA